jgi:hypothetical protein
MLKNERLAVSTAFVIPILSQAKGEESGLTSNWQLVTVLRR